MPIRFRCRYCNQLMGIARRKAGMTVHCPTCHGQVVVPQADAEDVPPSPPVKPAAAAQAPPPVPAPLFERSDFDELWQGPAAPAPAPQEVNPPVPPAPLPQAIPAPYEAERFNAPPLSFAPSPPASSPAGLLLSPTQATWLTVAAILLLALAFGAGLLVGAYWIH